MRVDELLLAGLTVEASVELRRGEAELIKRYGAPRALPLLFDRYVRGDNFNRPHQLAESYCGGALKIDPNSDSNARKWWEIVYPRAYRQFIEKYSPTGENPPYYLYTIMQKESAYNPHDVSYADAIGLLQMIPPTSRRVALRIDAPYTDDVLYDPEGNIRFGAWYIGHLLQKFKGQIALGAGSYNAGPRAMMKWVKLHGVRPLDEFVELTPYTQTREYMKKVLDIYSRYLWLYEKQDYLPDNKVDADYIENDIDY
jgi:soluble lytic murein transglycosylase-like protein